MTRIDANLPKRVAYSLPLWRFFSFISGCAIASLAAAHGVPIEVTIAGGALSVSHAENGNPALVFWQVGEASDPIGPVSLPGLGPSLLWDMPGLDIVGMNDSASLVLEPIARDFGNGSQMLWYWEPSSRRVITTPASAALNLLLADGSYATLTGSSGASSVTLAQTVAGQVGYHNHSLVNYSMPYASGFRFGLYGFFARFTSSEYAPSEMLLAIFNAGMAYEDLAPASEAIWLAANPGDYTLDGVVDEADYDAWAANYGGAPATAQTAADGNGDGVVDAADYTLWRDNVSQGAVSVPEPGAILLVLMSTPFPLRRRKQHL